MKQFKTDKELTSFLKPIQNRGKEMYFLNQLPKYAYSASNQER
nr:hypothetical protein [Seonamhaeicola sp. S2-3]